MNTCDILQNIPQDKISRSVSGFNFLVIHKADIQFVCHLLLRHARPLAGFFQVLTYRTHLPPTPAISAYMFVLLFCALSFILVVQATAMAKYKGKETIPFMKLDHNCIRAILLYSEEHLGLDEDLGWQSLDLEDYCDALPKYSQKEIAYTLYLLEEAGYVDAEIINADGGICDISVYRLTYSGHEFIDTIRSNKIWSKIASAVSTIGSASLPIIQELGGHYAIELLKQL